MLIFERGKKPASAQAGLTRKVWTVRVEMTTSQRRRCIMSLTPPVRIRPSRLLSLVGDEEQPGALPGLELRGAALAAEVVTDPQRVAVPLVDGPDRLALVGPA